MQKRKLFNVALVVVLALFVAACPYTQKLKSPVDMTPQEKAAFVLTLYNNAYDNYKAQFAATLQPMSDATKDYFRSYKQVLVTAEPVIDLYVSTVKAGGMPTAEQEQAILKLIYDFQAMVLAKKGA
jgi:hypothetical protein